MADLAPDYALGEDVNPETSELQIVEYGGTVAAGDFLKVTGYNADGNPIVATQTTTTASRFVAIVAGASGLVTQAIRRGITKVTFGGAVVVTMSAISVSANKAIAQALAGNGLGVGTSYETLAALDDTGLIYFDGAKHDGVA